MKRYIFFLLSMCFSMICYAQIDKTATDLNYRYGFIDSKGNWIIKPQYEFASWDWKAKLGTFRYLDEGPQGLIDETGKVIFPAEKYKNFYIFEEYGKWYVKITGMDGKVGLATREGRILVPCIYKKVYASTFAIEKDIIIEATSDNGQQAIYDSNGKQMFPAKYIDYDFSYYKDCKVVIVKNEQDFKGLIDETGKEIIPCEYANINLYDYKKNRIATVTNSNGLKGLVSSTGKIVIPCKYNDINLYNYKNGYVEVTNRQGLNALLKTPEYKEFTSFSYTGFSVYDNYILTRDNRNGKKYGIISHDGKVIAPCEYEDASLAAEDIALVCRGGHKEGYDIVGGKWGYVANGKEIIPCMYDAATSFKDDVATVKKDGEVKLIKNPLKDASQIQIAEGGSSVNNKKQRGPVVSRYPKPESDVDKNIPVAQKQAENTFAFIICNENYADAPVPYSLNDGRMFKEYCQKALGLPEKNINMYEDATFGNIITAIEKMKSIADAYDGEASVIFYYAGHGFPDDKQQTAYLLPIDGDASSITTTGYPLAKLYKEIAGLNLKSSIVFLDACFSGAKREDQMLASSRGVAIKVKEEAPQGKMVVFSAAQGDETAHQLEDMHHGLFTYYLLKGIQNAGGDPDMGTLTEYVTKQVKRQSVVINNKKQTPTVIPSQALQNNWQTMKLR